MFVGRQAPGFRVTTTRDPDTVGYETTLSDYKGRWLVLLFYAGDFAESSAADLRAFDAARPAFAAHDAELLAVGTDGAAAHAAWLRHGLGPLGFPLGSDRSQMVSQAYGVLTDGGESAPAVFLVDPDGYVRYEAVHDAGVPCSADEVLRVLAALRGTTRPGS